jgi:Domain of unknown function (DUF4157)
MKRIRKRKLLRSKANLPSNAKRVDGMLQLKNTKYAEEDSVAIQRKSSLPATFFSAAKPTSFIQSVDSGGTTLPTSSQHFFKARIGHDFSNVKIHTGNEAEASANDINARAYTIGENIVFNTNEYNPNSFAGKKLLAHELAHVMQHKQGSVASGFIQPQRSTPVPATAVIDPDTDIATFSVNSVNLVVEPDQTLRRGSTVTFHGQRIRVNRTGAVTAASLRPRVTPTYSGRGRSRRVTSVTLTYTLYIKTFYGTRAASSDTSGYGRGTTAADIAAGNTTLGFHEGSHGQDYQDYIAQNPLPQFILAVPANIRQYNAALRGFNREVNTYFTAMTAHSETHTDMVGTPMSP